MTMTEPNIPGYVSGTWTLDPAHTEIGFVVRHLMVSKVRGHFEKFTATITTTADPFESHAEAQIDLSSITTGNDQRDGHLRSSDFFDVDTHPTMTFRSTGFRRDGDAFFLDGDLTIRGVTRPTTLTVEVGGFGPDPAGGKRAGFSATTEINRTDFGVSWNATIEGGGAVVSDKVTINIEAEAVLDT
ncbi:YceI family protein [Lapillicoccus sp.]|uniref:YceI family protein n=1 Tax=Lapillicoccus sp. TaxID=1909287 RepID=UPI003267D4CD